MFTGKDKFNTRISAMSMWIERWFTSTNAKDIGTLYLIFALFSGLLGTAFSVLIRMELSGPGVQYIADNQLYNSIITAHALLMIFFMVKKKNNIFNFKSLPSLKTEKVNNDNNNFLTGNNNDGNNNFNNPKYRYVKVLVNDPFNNRDIILKVTKKQKGVYVWESLDGKHIYVGSAASPRVLRSASHSINQRSWISSSALSTTFTATNYKLNTRRYYSSLPKMNPWFLTGFLDGESSFYIILDKSNNVKTGWSVRAVFEIHLHLKDITLLEEIQTTLGGVGGITIIDNKVSLKIYYRDLAILLDHLNNYPLITKKQADFKLFKEALDLMSRKEHLTPEGLLKIVSIKASMNKGLSEKLQDVFPNVVPVLRPILNTPTIADPNWLAGFVSAEGCFSIHVGKSESSKSGYRAWSRFQVTQHSRDEALMETLPRYLNCGRYYPKSNSEVGDFVVSKLSDIIGKIIPFFEKYPILGVKCLDFKDFCKASELIKNKAHLTNLGLDQIKEIKAAMNRGRST